MEATYLAGALLLAVAAANKAEYFLYTSRAGGEGQSTYLLAA